MPHLHIQTPTLKKHKEFAMDEERAKILLKAAYDLLHKQTETPYVLDMLTETAVWDGAECDGYCLLEDIAEFLGIEEE